jgi:Flp pilus assembly CpaF family ATPase
MPLAMRAVFSVRGVEPGAKTSTPHNTINRHSVAVDGPLLSIRRFGRHALKGEDLVAKLAMTEGMLELLKGCVKARLNILICGGTGRS